MKYILSLKACVIYIYNFDDFVCLSSIVSKTVWSRVFKDDMHTWILKWKFYHKKCVSPGVKSTFIKRWSLTINNGKHVDLLL